MLKHIVMMRLKETTDPVERTQRAWQLKSALDELPGQIPEILEWETGINVNPFPQAFDLVLVSVFADDAALDIYRNHADHQKVLGFIRQVVKDLAVVDYPA